MPHILFLLFACFSLSAMEEEPLLDGTDGIELNEQLEQIIDEEELPSPLYDESRRFYDEKSRHQARKKAWRECFKLTALHGLTMSGILGGLACAVNAIVYRVLATVPGTDKEVFSSYMIRATVAETAIIPIFNLAGLGIGYFFEKVVPVIKEHDPFETYKHANKCIRCFCNGGKRPHEATKFPLDFFEAQTIPQTICSPRKNIDSFLRDVRLNLESRRFCKLRRFIFPSDRTAHETVKKVDARLHQILPPHPQAPLREEYPRIAFQLKKFLRANLSRDTMQYLSQFFIGKNILLHMLSNRPEFWLNPELNFVTEKEFLTLSLHLGKSHAAWYRRKEMKLYYFVSILAQNGWLSLNKSSKYPIRCNMKFFDNNVLPENIRPYYFASFDANQDTTDVRPTVFLPYHPDLSRYYKFEEDQEYASEFENPSNEKIRRLLELRQELIARPNEL